MEKNITLGTSADINFVVNSISNGSKSVNPWPLFQTSGGLFWQEKG